VTTLPGFPRLSGPRYLTVGRDGTLWVGLEQSHQVARVTGVVAPTTSGGGGGGSTPPPADTTAPVLTNVRAPASLRVGSSGTLRLTLSEDATIAVRFERKLPGRRTARGRCVAPRRHASHGRRCTRFVVLGSQRRSARAGANALAIGGKLGRRTLPVGHYRLTIVASDVAGNVSKPVRRTLTVAPKPRRRAARRP
ncbi:MAG TPA: hypothetical protein VFG31_04125, partial [Conexibacter sp.]|nr:hypothetical protein [Conexibacter sp.]